jgi:hypothetical protein
MTGLLLLLWFSFVGQLPSETSGKQPESKPQLDRSAYFAFVDHDYIFTVEIVKPGVPILNFVSMNDREAKLWAKNIRFTLENRKAAVKSLVIETGVSSQVITAITLTIHPRSSFGVRVNGDFDKASEFLGASILLGDEELTLAPLSNFDFEILAAKVNRINLGSPDFNEDWRVLRLRQLGDRSAIRGRQNRGDGRN